MTTPFHITHDVRGSRWESEFDLDDYVDTEPLMLAWFHFESLYEGDVNVTVGEHVIPFELGADIGMIFDELPGVLAQVAAGEEAELYFAEQGTDLQLAVRPRDETVEIEVRRGSESGSLYEHLPEQLGTVSRSEFIRAWRSLAEDLLGRLEDLEPGLAEDEGTRDYRAQLARADAPSEPA